MVTLTPRPVCGSAAGAGELPYTRLTPDVRSCSGESWCREQTPKNPSHTLEPRFALIYRLLMALAHHMRDHKEVQNETVWPCAPLRIGPKSILWEALQDRYLGTTRWYGLHWKR